jgi:hypothetical protein
LIEARGSKPSRQIEHDSEVVAAVGGDGDERFGAKAE